MLAVSELIALKTHDLEYREIVHIANKLLLFLAFY